MKIRVGHNQTLLDIAIQHCGSAEAAFSIAMLNNISVTDDLVLGTELVNAPVMNQAIVDYYARNGIVPASGANVISVAEVGIGKMIIGSSFIIR